MTVVDITDNERAGFAPPQDLPAEQCVLGSMLSSSVAIAEVIETLTPEDFYKPAHATVFDAIVDMYGQGLPVDPVTVTDHLTKQGYLGSVGGAPYLHTLLQAVPSVASVTYYATIVRNKAVLRRLVTAGTRIQQWGQNGIGEPADLVDHAQEEIYALTTGKPGDEYATASELLTGTLEELDAIQRGDTRTAIPTGFTELDETLGGLHDGQLVVIAGRPGSGKSTLAIDIARHAALTCNHPTIVFSLEMLKNEIMMRILSAEASVPLHAMRTRGTGHLTEQHWHKLSTAMPKADTTALYIDDSPDINTATIRAKSRRLKQRHGLRLIIVDYLQLMTGRRAETRQQEVADLSRTLKKIAVELELPIIVLSQLNRGPEQRVDKKPMMSDLRESGAIEQDADVALLVYREDMYDPQTPRQGEADILIAKHRNGPTGTVTLAFQGHYSRFTNMHNAP